MDFFQLLRQEVAYVAAPDDDDPAGLRLFVSEDRHAARNVQGVDGEIHLVADQHLIVAPGHDEAGNLDRSR